MKKEVFDTKIDIDFLKKVQAHVTCLICALMNSVTSKGYQFPGSSGPGTSLLY